MLGWEMVPHYTGGMGVACYYLCKHLAIRGFEIDFMVPYKAEHPGTEFMNVIPALPYTSDELHTYFNGAYDSNHFFSNEKITGSGLIDGKPRNLTEQRDQYIAGVRSHARDYRDYDAIHAHDWLAFEAGVAAREELHVPLILHVHATEFDRSGELFGNPLVHEIEEFCLSVADHVIAVSQATKDLIVREYGIDPEKVSVVYNAIDHADYAAVETSTSYPYLQHMKSQGYTVVSIITRLTIQKGLTYLLRGLQLAVQKNPKILLLLCGTGEQYRELITLSADLGIANNVLFTGGFVTGKARQDGFVIGDVFIMSSVSEPFGVSALEAVGFGSTVVLTRQSGVSEVLHNVLKYDYWDIERLADQLVSLADNHVLRDELRANSRLEFERISWHDVAEKCHSVYDKMIPMKAATV